MATRSTIKDRCRLCYTRLKDTSSSHHKLWFAQHNHRIHNIYKRRPYRYRDLIVRYLCIRLPENEVHANATNSLDQYSHVVCSTCAASLNKLDTAFRTFQQTQKVLRSKFRKTSQIVHYHLDRQRASKSTNVEQRGTSVALAKDDEEEKEVIVPKRQSKRKGAPKHINQTVNSQTNKASGQLVVKIPSPKPDQNEADEQRARTSLAPASGSTKRTSPRRKPLKITDGDDMHPKKKFKPIAKAHETSNHDAYSCINLLKPSILSDIPISTNLTPLNLTGTPGSLSSSSNSRLFNSVKGNHIERIAVSLLSGTDTLADTITAGSNQSNGAADHSRKRTRGQRKAPTSLEVSTTNNILGPAVPSPSFDETDDDRLSIGAASNDSSDTNRSNDLTNGSTIPNVNKQLPSSISTTPTAEGLTITAINQTGQKQVFMAKQLGNLKKYQCGLCEKIVTNIQIHVRRHTNDKPYPCTYCEKRFTNSGDLQIHVRIHTGEKPYGCPLCLKSYRTIGNFNSHVKTHDSGTRPHRCDLCDQTFPIPKDWYSHLRSSHRSRTANTNRIGSSSATTTTVTKPLFSNSLSSQQAQQQNETFIPSKVKLEPINRSQLIIKSVNDDGGVGGGDDDDEADDQEPVNMSKKENYHDEDEEQENEDDEDGGGDRRSTQNLLIRVPSPVHA